MPNTGKSHHQPHAYPTAREKALQTPQLQQQQQQAHQQEQFFPPPLPPPARSAISSHFVPDGPLSARPFMTMVAPAPTHYHPFYQQHEEQQAVQQLQVQHSAASPPQFPSYSSFQPPALATSRSHSRSSNTTGAVASSRAFNVYERLQLTEPAPHASNPRTAWREEIEQRARAMERSSAAAFVGGKRPALHSSTSPQTASPYSARAFAQAPTASAAAVGVLPTLSLVLQRTADASSSPTPPTTSHASSSELSHHQYVPKRQRMFEPLHSDVRDEHTGDRLRFPHDHREQPARRPTGAPPAPIASLYRRSDLTDVDNDHLRSILEKEIAMYNQLGRPTPQLRPVHTGATSSLYEPPSAKYVNNRPTSIVYSNAERSGVYAGGSDADSPPLTYRRDAVSPRVSLLEHQQQQLRQHHHTPSPQEFSRYTSSAYAAGASTETPSSAKYAPSSMASSASPQTRHFAHQPYHRDATPQSQSQAQYHLRRDTSLPPTRTYANPLDVAPLQSQKSPPPQLAPPSAPATARRPQYAVNVSAPSPQSGYESPRPTSSRTGVSNQTSASHTSRTTLMRTTTTTTSGYRRRTAASGAADDDDDPHELSGEAVIEAASGLVEERSPSKRESITKLLLKSKEFLKAKSLVRNRNNEIDWVATFLNVGFESSSIYSLMCPLRKGRWKVEEEKYTMELLRLVESGTVRLRHGQSIRGFIAKKLHSDDMRVLKKLSNCKMFHFARAITPHMAEEEAIDDRVPGAEAALERLEKLRSEFLRSVQLEALVAVRKYLSDSSIRELLNGRD